MENKETKKNYILVFSLLFIIEFLAMLVCWEY